MVAHVTAALRATAAPGIAYASADRRRPEFPSSSLPERKGGLRWKLPPRFNGQPGSLEHAVPGAPGFRWSSAVEFRERLSSAGATDPGCSRLQDLDWGGITLEVIGPLLAPLAFEGPSAFVPPTLAEARALCRAAFGRIPERIASGFGAWLADCLWTEISVQAGTADETVQFTVVPNRSYRALAILAQAAKPLGAQEWEDDPVHCNATFTGDAYESLVGLWYLEGEHDLIRGLMLALINIDQPECRSWSPQNAEGIPQRPACTFRLREERASPYAVWCHEHFAITNKYRAGELPHPDGAPAG
eukprot:12029668-Heterocapsa_arctica.AAC.1